MTLASTTSKVQYNGNGSTTAFPFSFKFTAANEIEVILTSSAGVDAIKAITTHYTLSSPGDSGTVTMITAPASGEVLTIRRIMPLTQTTDLNAGGGFSAATIEAALDKLAMIGQQLLEKIRRAPKFRDGSTSSEPTLPEPSASAVIAWNAAGTALENRTIATDAVLDPLGPSDIRDFGAIGNGVANDTAAVSNAFNEGTTIFVPAGTYLIDPITVSSPVHVIMHPSAVIKRRSATTGADSYLIAFGAGADGSIIEGGTIDGDRDAFAASFGSNPQALWPGIYLAGADRITVRNMRFINGRTMPIWAGNTFGHIIENVVMEDCDRVILFQFTEDSICRNVVAKNIGNDGVNQYQHACEFRNLNRCTIENIRIDGYEPDAQGEDPWPVAFALERIFDCRVDGLFLDGYDGTETRNYGAQISNAQRSAFSNIHVNNVFWGIEFQTAIECSLSDFSVDGAFKEHASSDGAGLQFFSGGVFQVDPTDSSFDHRANTPSKNVMVSNGSVIGCEVGVIVSSPNIHFSNVVSNANATYGFQLREQVTNGFLPGQPKQRVENILLSNCEARLNGFDGLLASAGNQIMIDGGVYADNGWDDSLGADFRSGIHLDEDATAGGISAVSISNVYCGDTQDFTRTDGASFEPGATSSNRFDLTLLNPDNISVGQWIVLKNATGAGDVTARVVDVNLDEVTVETSGAVTFSETGNLNNLTGTLSSSGNTVTGSGTAFTTEIKGAGWLKIGGAYYKVSRVNSNTECVIFPAPSPALSGASAQLIAIDIDGIPSQQYGINTDADTTGPVSLANVNAIGAVTAATDIATPGCLDALPTTANVFAQAGLYMRGGRISFGSTDLLQAVSHIHKDGDDNMLCLQGQSNGKSFFGQFTGIAFWQAENIDLEIGTNTASNVLAFRTAGTRRVLMTDGAFSPSTNDGMSLGTGSLKWSDLHLASGGVINWDNGDVLITHSANAIALTGGTIDFSCSNATTATDYVRNIPTNFGAGNPYMSLSKRSGATAWAISLWDGSASTGTIEINSSVVTFPSITTTASAANAFLNSGASNSLLRSTSSLRYKRDVEDLDHEAADQLFSLRPVWYRSKADADPAEWSWYGLIAEEVAEVDPRLVHWTYPDEAFDLIEHKVPDVVQQKKRTIIDEETGEQRVEFEEVVTPGGVQVDRVLKEGAKKVPDGVQYDRLTVLLLDLVRRQEARIKTLEARV